MKVLILGIDALDQSLLNRFGDQLPNFSQIIKDGSIHKVKTTFPPDSDTAWATISTGLNPAQHGIVHFVDPLEKSYQIQNKQIDNTILHGKTFWEIAGEAGFKTCVVFPHLCYPVWNVPGVMIARGSSIVDVQATPPEVLRKYPDPKILTGVRGFPERSVAGMLDYHHRLTAQTQADAEFALRLMNEQDWDLFFVYWSTIDAAGHFFWNYFDPQDPGFVEGHPLQNVILETYQLYDEILGRFLTSVPADTAVIIVSDHGHGARPYNLVAVNEVLHQGGFLSAKEPAANPHINLVEKTKRLAVETISRYGLGKLAGRVMRNFPRVIQGFTRPAWINWDRTIAYTTDLSGIKAYAYGGIRINRAAANGKDYEAIRSEIITYLEHKLVLPDGTPLLKFISRREDLYMGPFIEQYPDIVFEFQYGYGVGWALFTPLITQAASYNLVPGSHRGDTGTFIIKGSDNLYKPDITIDLEEFPLIISDILNNNIQGKISNQNIPKIIPEEGG